MSIFLTRDEIIDLTGAKQTTKQRQWLVSRGYTFDTRMDGSIVVLKAHMEQKLNNASSFQKKRAEPNFDALMRMG